MTAEEYIKAYTRGCSNETINHLYHEWLTPENALAAVELAREEMMKVVEQLKAQAEKRYDEIGKSGYIQPNQPLAKGTDNIVTIEYANNHNKEHAASLGYYNGVIRTCEKIVCFLKDSANEGNSVHQ
jgi:hypothetical protein